MNNDVNDNEDFTDRNEGCTDDIFECLDCGHQGHAVGPIYTDWVPRPFGSGLVPMHTLGDPLRCEECRSTNVREFVRKPTKVQMDQYKIEHGTITDDDKQSYLTEIDPEWRERFGGDIERALEFYK